MANPLDQFGNSPRVFVNDPANGGKALQSTPRIVLGPGIVASIEPANPVPGEVIVMHLDAPAAGEVVELQTQVDGIDTRLTAAELSIADIEPRLTAAEGDLSTLDTRVDAVEPYAVGGGLWTVTPVKVSDYTAGFGEFVQVDLGDVGLGGNNINVTLPAPGGAPPGSQIIVADVSTDGGIAQNNNIVIVATFAALASGATSPYTVVNGRGARIHLIVDHTGSAWQIFSETQRP